MIQISTKINTFSSQVADTSLGVPDFSEIIGRPLAVLVGCPRFSIGFTPFFKLLPSALDLSKDPKN